MNPAKRKQETCDPVLFEPATALTDLAHDEELAAIQVERMNKAHDDAIIEDIHRNNLALKGE